MTELPTNVLHRLLKDRESSVYFSSEQKSAGSFSVLDAEMIVLIANHGICMGNKPKSVTFQDAWRDEASRIPVCMMISCSFMNECLKSAGLRVRREAMAMRVASSFPRKGVSFLDLFLAEVRSSAVIDSLVTSVRSLALHCAGNHCVLARRCINRNTKKIRVVFDACSAMDSSGEMCCVFETTKNIGRNQGTTRALRLFSCSSSCFSSWSPRTDINWLHSLHLVSSVELLRLSHCGQFVLFVSRSIASADSTEVSRKLMLWDAKHNKLHEVTTLCGWFVYDFWFVADRRHGWFSVLLTIRPVPRSFQIFANGNYGVLLSNRKSCIVTYSFVEESAASSGETFERSVLSNENGMLMSHTSVPRCGTSGVAVMSSHSVLPVEVFPVIVVFDVVRDCEHTVTSVMKRISGRQCSTSGYAMSETLDRLVVMYQSNCLGSFHSVEIFTCLSDKNWICTGAMEMEPGCSPMYTPACVMRAVVMSPCSKFCFLGFLNRRSETDHRPLVDASSAFYVLTIEREEIHMRTFYCSSESLPRFVVWTPAGMWVETSRGCILLGDVTCDSDR